MKFNIKKNITLFVLLSFVVFSILLGLFIYYGEKLETETNSMKNEVEMLIKCNGIFISVINIESGTRGYALTGDESYLENYDSVEAGIHKNFKEIRKLTKDLSKQKIKIDSLETLVSERLAFNRKIIELRKNRRFEELQSLFSREKVMGNTESIEALINKINIKERALIEQQSIGIGTNDINSKYGFNLVIVGIAFIFALVAFLIYENNISRTVAEMNLMESNDYLQNLFNYSTSLIIVWDPQFKITRFNHAFEAFTGKKADEVIGQSVRTIFPLDSAENSMEYIKRTLKGEHWNSYEINILHVNGSIKTALWNSSNVLGSDGKTIVATIAQGLDISERKLIQEELITANSELALQNEEKEKRSLELLLANNELEQFAYVASHDLQEPLRMITSYLQLLKRRYKDKLDDDANDFIQFAVDGATRMQKLITDLLDYSRISNRGKEFEPIDTSKILEMVISNLKLLIENNSAVITQDELPVIRADETQILRVFQNLIENAIKFKKKTETPIIHISCEKKNDMYEFSVCDNGIGMDMQFHDKVFIIFKRLHAATEYPGTGIGLSIDKRIIERHGGKIWFESKVDEGTTFYFTIPA